MPRKTLKSVIRLRKALYTRLLTLLYEAKVGHIGSCLSVVDILIYLWLYEKNAKDKVLLSKGHAAPALYVVLEHLGILSSVDINSFNTDGTRLGIHPPHHFKKYIPFATGSLGHGLSLSAGIAQGYMFQGKKNRVFCVMSDGECNEGQVWEAAQYASSKKLGNLYVFIDKNNIQAFGKTGDVLGDGAAANKWKAFGFAVAQCNGHDLTDMYEKKEALEKNFPNKPKILICDTIKGKGVSYMQDTIDWHYNEMTDELYQQALQDIETML